MVTGRYLPGREPHGRVHLTEYSRLHPWVLLLAISAPSVPVLAEGLLFGDYPLLPRDGGPYWFHAVSLPLAIVAVFWSLWRLARRRRALEATDSGIVWHAPLSSVVIPWTHVASVRARLDLATNAPPDWLLEIEARCDNRWRPPGVAFPSWRKSRSRPTVRFQLHRLREEARRLEHRLETLRDELAPAAR